MASWWLANCQNQLQEFQIQVHSYSRIIDIRSYWGTKPIITKMRLHVPDKVTILGTDEITENLHKGKWWQMWIGKKLPHGILLNVNFPSASERAWQRALSDCGELPVPWGQLTSITSSEYKYIWTPNIGFPCQKDQNLRTFSDNKIWICEASHWDNQYDANHLVW